MNSSSRLRRRPLVLAVAVTLPLAMAASGALAQNVDLGNLGARGFRMDGIVRLDSSGKSVSGAGDVNGDGLADVIVGAYRAGLVAGESYVVFGRTDTAPVDLGALGTGGFRIDGIDTIDFSGWSVSGAGDVNGDGLADLIIGAPRADPGGVGNAGESYVVFGKTDGTTVDLGALGTGGFRIDGIDANDLSGFSVSGAGDINGDGLADLIVGAHRADAGGDVDAGKSYVVFGKTDPALVDLGALDAGGFRIDGDGFRAYSGFSVSGAGDVNGDGLADLIIGAHGTDLSGYSYTSESYVVFGKTDNQPVDLAALGAGGFQINGASADASGRSVSGAGDVNGDGRADLIVGTPLASHAGVSGAGESYVVFGKASHTPVNLAALDAGGFQINGIDDGDLSGCSVSGAGDVNGDGLADLIVGAYMADAGGDLNAGESYVVFGKTDPALVDLAALGTGGFRIDGIDNEDRSGFSVSGAGDVNGDGLADLIIGAYGARPGGDDVAGESYVVFGAAVPPLSTRVRVRSASGNSPRTAFGITGDGSDDSTPAARAWIDFADGSDLLTAISTEIVTLTRSAGPLPLPGANVSWRLQTTRQDWSTAELKLRYLDAELISSENLLEIVFSPNGMAPFTALATVVNPFDNTVTANITQAGFFYLGQRVLPPEIFADGFE